LMEKINRQASAAEIAVQVASVFAAGAKRAHACLRLRSSHLETWAQRVRQSAPPPPPPPHTHTHTHTHRHTHPHTYPPPHPHRSPLSPPLRPLAPPPPTAAPAGATLGTLCAARPARCGSCTRAATRRAWWRPLAPAASPRWTSCVEGTLSARALVITLINTATPGDPGCLAVCAVGLPCRSAFLANRAAALTATLPAGWAPADAFRGVQRHRAPGPPALCGRRPHPAAGVCGPGRRGARARPSAARAPRRRWCARWCWRGTRASGGRWRPRWPAIRN
jgi:hypothetical protein